MQLGAQFTPALPDATSTQGIKPKGVPPNISDLAQQEQERKFTFTPNVPIPRLFAGEQEVTSGLIGSYIAAFFIYFTGVVSILAVVMMMWGGFHYITSAGNAQRMRQGKEIISNALIGLILTLTSVLLLGTINPALVNFRGLVPSFVRQILQPIDDIIEPEKIYTRCDQTGKSDITKEMPTVLSRITNGGYDKKISANAGSLDKYRLLATLAVESRGDPKAMSTFKNKNGEIGHACGLMQVTPPTISNRYTCEQLMDPDIGITEGIKVFAQKANDPCLRKQNSFCGSCKEDDPTFTHAAYNAGQGTNRCSDKCNSKATIWQCEKNSSYSETRCYVDDVEKAYNWLKANFTF